MKLEVKTGIKIEIHNKDTALGCYYREDDWSIEAVAPTYEEAIRLIIPECIKSNIWPCSIYISNVEYVVYNNNKYIINDTDKTPPTLIYNNVLTDIKEHPLFEKLSKEKHEKMKAEKVEELKRESQENEKNERKLLEKLDKEILLVNYISII